MNDREIRAFSILAKGDKPKQIDEETFIIPSQNGNGKYKVVHRQEWLCECPDFRYRHVECKHIKAVKFWLKFRNKVEIDDLDINEVLGKEQCIFCKSFNIKKEGFRKNKSGKKQKYRCKDCGKYFVLDPVKHVKGNGKIVTLAMDLYFKGLSLRDISDTIYQFYNIRLHHETIRRWILKFTKIMNDYVNKLQPKTSGVWQADEQMIKSKGKWLWSWNVLDAETRMLLANEVTENRYVEDARKVFKKAKDLVKENPDVIITDGLWSYEKAVRKELQVWKGRSDRTQHIRLRTIRDRIQNNKVERYHGTFREFDKIRRAFKGSEKEMLQAFRLYYNFIKKHHGLNGLTPSQIAQINLNLGRNRWLGLLERSLNEKNKRS
jgi:transposase-like protein